MKTPTRSARQPISPKKHLKRHLRRQLRPVIERSRVLKFGIKGVTAVRERAEGIRRWVTASALRISQGPRD
jgi:hypothetical protein